MMRNVKALAAIVAALFLGLVAVTLLSGCQPARPSRPRAGGTTGSTTNAAPKITIPKEEVKDESPDKPAEKSPMPKGEPPTDANPAGVKPADEKADADKPVDAKAPNGNGTAILPKGET